MANIYYELGLMQAYGRETLVVRVGRPHLPSDLVRTEYLSLDDRFDENLRGFLAGLGEQAEHYRSMASQLERNPLLAIDYLRRAFLLTADSGLRSRARRILMDAKLEDRAANSVERLLAGF